MRCKQYTMLQPTTIGSITAIVTMIPGWGTLIRRLMSAEAVVELWNQAASLFSPK